MKNQELLKEKRKKFNAIRKKAEEQLIKKEKVFKSKLQRSKEQLIKKQLLLKEVFQRATNNGWKDGSFYLEYFDMLKSKEPSEQMMAKSKIFKLMEDLDSILFDHRFSRTFFGMFWRKELQALVIQKNKLQWLFEKMEIFKLNIFIRLYRFIIKDKETLVDILLEEEESIRALLKDYDNPDIKYLPTIFELVNRVLTENKKLKEDLR